MVRETISRLATVLNSGWQQDRTSILVILIGSGVLLALSTVVDVAYKYFGVVSITQLFYFYLGLLSFCLCMFVLLARGKWRLPLAVLLFLLNDIALRLAFSFVERTPGTYVLDLSFVQAACIFGVRLLFLLPVLGVHCLRSRFNPLYYWLTACFFAFVAFCLSAVYVPYMMRENLCSHRVRYAETPGRAIAIDDDAAFLLEPFLNAKGTQPLPVRIVQHDGQDIVLDGWDECESLCGFTRHSDGTGFRVVLVLSPRENETVQTRLIHYMDGQIVEENSLEFPCHLAPNRAMNCLSPGGAFVALNNGVLLDFSDPDRIYHVFEEAPEVTHRFIEWTAAPEERALYYHETKNQVILVDPYAQEQVAIHSLTFREPVITSLTLSPDGQRLLYAGRLTYCFFIENFGTNEVEYRRVRWSEVHFPSLRPFWINDARFMYVSQSMHLHSIDDTGITRLSQLMSVVQWAYYEPATQRVIWTTIHHGVGSMIHAYKVDL